MIVAAMSESRSAYARHLLREKALQSVDGRGGWFRIHEPFTGAWQQNREVDLDTALTHPAVYACVTLIASDMGKLRPRLVRLMDSGVWRETDSAAFSPVIRRPNRYQNHVQFKEWWAQSKLIHGNTYALKRRDNRGVVTELYLLDPTRVTPMVADDGSVFYKLSNDNLSRVGSEGTTVPASEIIHDRMNALFHPLVGISPIYAAGLAAKTGINIANNSEAFFRQGSNPSGVLSGPQHIDEATAKRLAEQWNASYGGDRSGRVAIMGNDLKFQALRMAASESQLIEQLSWADKAICTAFRVPPFKIATGQMPTYQNGETLDGIYYKDCLQSHIEGYEAAMDDGLGIGIGSPKEGVTLGVELDLSGLFRMDTATQIKSLSEGVRGGFIAPNEARRQIDLEPVEGGDTPYLQHQDYPLATLVDRPAPDSQASNSSTSAPSEDNEERAADEVAAWIYAGASDWVQSEPERETVQ